MLPISGGSNEGLGLALAASSSPGLLLLVAEGSVVGLGLAFAAGSSPTWDSSIAMEVVAGKVFAGKAIAPGEDNS